jgi:hypothetical protein
VPTLGAKSWRLAQPFLLQRLETKKGRKKVDELEFIHSSYNQTKKKPKKKKNRHEGL